MTGPRLLSDWLTSTGTSLRAAADQLRCSHTAVRFWRDGRYQPCELIRQRLAAVAGIPTEAWGGAL